MVLNLIIRKSPCFIDTKFVLLGRQIGDITWAPFGRGNKNTHHITALLLAITPAINYKL